MNLTTPDLSPAELAQLLDALRGLKAGDFRARLPGEWTGVGGKIADTFNEIVAANLGISDELERLSREVGVEGRIEQRAEPRAYTGSWIGMVRSMNTLVEELVRPTLEMSRVVGAVAKGDLSQSAELDSGGRPLRGEFLKTANTVNTMVNLLSSFTSEVTRVAREVGTEGKLGGQALVPGVAGTWKDLTDNVNFMASNLTSQVRNIADITTAVANGDFSKKITADVRGEVLQLKDKVNTMVDQLSLFTSEVTRVAREVGTEGKLGSQAIAPGAAGTWKDLTDNVNFMASNLTSQVRNIADITTAVANGDFTKKVTADVRGEFLQLKDKVNTMVDQLGLFTSEVTRVAREVGVEGKLGSQAIAPGAAGTWKDLTDNVNFMASNLTSQVRNIADITTAVANGDLSTKITADVRGEFLQLKEKVNTMVDQLRFFTSEVTRVAREVGVEGRLGQQAIAPGAAGTWKELTDNVNQLAANLTTQVRAIVEVAISVTRGDLTRSISMDARGEVETLKDTLNQMIANLRLTTQKNADQVWLKTNLAGFALMLQGQTDLQTVSAAILTELSKAVGAQHGVFYIADSREGEDIRLKPLSTFAYRAHEDLARDFALGEGLVGQCARDKKGILVADPPASYIKISSGLGEEKPANILVLPILFEGRTKAVLELATFGRFSPTQMDFLEQLMEGIGIVLHTLEANLRTEALLKSLQVQQEVLRKTNQALEEKADQLALTSKYKSEFLSNMSHELRTPLNSMLILSQQLAEDPKDLTAKQVEYAKTIHASGGDLLNLINDILDLSKVESGTLVLEMEDVPVTGIQQHLERIFEPLAEGKGLKFSIDMDDSQLTRIHTDGKRLEQILRNLLSNAFKFTEKGQVLLKVEAASTGWNPEHPVLSQAGSVIAFTVTDTGIGIPLGKQKIIFEAFQQADSGTSRKYGGTGLGLSISRELAKLLGCQLVLASSTPGKGSTFVLYVPSHWAQEGEAPPSLAPETPRLPAQGTALVRPSDKAPRAPIADDRKSIRPGDPVLLIVEDDRAFSAVILEEARLKGFKGLVAHEGWNAMKLAEQFKPDAITLDIHLPDMDGWGVLAHFKNDPAMRHIPVEIISQDEDRRRSLRQGALAFLVKPVDRHDLSEALATLRGMGPASLKRLLLLSPKKARSAALTKLLQGDDVALTLVASAAEAVAALTASRFDCLVLEAPEPEGAEVLKALAKGPAWAAPPVVVHATRELTPEEEALLEAASQAGAVKKVDSTERLLDEAALHLHRPIAGMPQGKKMLIENLHQKTPVLSGKKALVVDDDIRNIFAMTSLLENHHMNVLSAESGALALELLDKDPAIDVVLMDIMMPEMDGYEAMQRIRKDPRFKALPIIALTAKAMKGDREKCIDLGASDYITKPVDTNQLLSMLRLWLHR